MEEPTDEDCCHSDCQNCILDVYRKIKALNGTNQTTESHLSSFMSPFRYKPFNLVKIESDSSDTNIYTFVVEGSEQGLSFNPGQHVILRNDPKADEEHLSRAYTLIPWSCPGVLSTFSILVRLYADGKMSQYIRLWTTGHTILWRGPYGEFTYKANAVKHIVMACMGTGVAPMFAIAKHVVDNEKDDTTIHLLQGSRTVETIVLRSAINSLRNFWNFKCTRFISEGFQESQKRLNETFITGRMGESSIVNALESARKPALVLICGSEVFNGSMRDAVLATGLSKECVHVFS